MEGSLHRAWGIIKVSGNETSVVMVTMRKGLKRKMTVLVWSQFGRQTLALSAGAGGGCVQLSLPTLLFAISDIWLSALDMY